MALLRPNSYRREWQVKEGNPATLNPKARFRRKGDGIGREGRSPSLKPMLTHKEEQIKHGKVQWNIYPNPNLGDGVPR